MLIVGAERFDEHNRGQALVLQVREEVNLVLQVRRRNPIAHAIRPRGVVVVVRERLVVPLEQWVHRRVRWHYAIVGRIACRAG